MQSHLNVSLQFGNDSSPVYTGNLLGSRRAVLAVSSYSGTAVKLQLIYTIINYHENWYEASKRY